MSRVETNTENRLSTLDRFLSHEVTCCTILEDEKLYVMFFFVNKK
jgi:hypothetical protein